MNSWVLRQNSWALGTAGKLIMYKAAVQATHRGTDAWILASPGSDGDKEFQGMKHQHHRGRQNQKFKSRGTEEKPSVLTNAAQVGHGSIH